MSTSVTREQVAVNSPASSDRALQRQCACGVHTLGGGECDQCRASKGYLQRAAVTSAPGSDWSNSITALTAANISGSGHRHGGNAAHREVPVPLSFQNSSALEGIISGLDSGNSLPRTTQQSVQEETGYAPPAIRVHDDPKSRATADFFNSEAFTIGPHIVFGNALTHQPGKRDWVLMHEVAHSLQQTAPGSAVQTTSTDHELEADRFADRATARKKDDQRGLAKLSPAAVGMQRRVIWKHIRELPGDLLLIMDVDDGDFVGGCVRRIVPHVGIKLIRRHPHTQLFNVHIGFLTNARGEFCVFFYESVTGVCTMLCFASPEEMRERWDEVLEWLREQLWRVLRALAILALIVAAAYLIYMIIQLAAAALLVLA